jgi:protein AroM
MPDMMSLLGGRYEISQAGALDDFGLTETRERFAPRGGEAALVTRLRDGSLAELSEARVLPLVQAAITQAARNAEAMVLLCTGKFPAFTCQVPLLVPYDLLHGLVPRLARGLKVGALFPFESHAPGMLAGWREEGLEIISTCLRPPGTREGLEEALRLLPDIGLLVLDCIGYTAETRDAAAEIGGLPVLHPKTLIARMLDSLAI